MAQGTITTVTGTVGNDVLRVPAGTQLVTGNGGNDIVNLGDYQYFAGYKIVKNTDGSVTLTDSHGGTLTNTRMVGITTLQFTDGTYSVATGQFTPGAKATVASSSAVATATPAGTTAATVTQTAVSAAKTVTGTASNEIINVPAGTQLINGAGGTDIVNLGKYQYFAGYKIVKNTDGSITVTDTHSGTLTNTKMVGIATLQFTDGTYNVATAQFISGAKATLPTATSTPPVTATAAPAQSATTNSQSSGTMTTAANTTASNAKTVTGTSGNEILKVPAGTQLVNGGGGTDIVDLGKYQYYAGYKIVKNTDGSVTVTDTHSGTLTYTKMVGIATLQFTDGTYNVASGKFTPSAKVTLPATPSEPTSPTQSSGTTPPVDTSVPAAKTVTGTTANEILKVPAGTLLVKGAGGTDIVNMGQYQYYTGYKIVKNADGSVTVTDTHSGTLTNTKMVGISTLQFTDGAYDVASGKFTSGAKVALPTTSGTSTGSTSSGGTTPSTTNKTVTGTAGNDVLKVPAGTQLVNGGGGTDKVNMGEWQYHTSYQITRNSDGSINVTDVHGGTLTNTKMVGISTLEFTDGSYNVATGQFTAGTTSSGTSSPGTTTGSTGSTSTGTTGSTSSSSGNITAPQVSHGAGDVVGVRIENNESSATAARTVTFGQTFAEGDVPRGTHLMATINGQQVPVQMDVQTHNDDGSVAQAILTVQVPSIAARSAIQIGLDTASGPATGTALDPHNFVARGFETSVDLTIDNFHGNGNGNGNVGHLHIDVGAALNQALAAGTAKTWMQGPLATEVRISVPINGSLTAQFDIRGNADGTFSTDVVIQNDKIYSSDSKTYTYDIVIASHGQTLLSQADITQTPMQNFERLVWSSAQGATTAPKTNVVYDVPYLEKTGAVPTYETSTGFSRNTLAHQAAELAASNTKALGAGMVIQYEPMTGGRPDIGPTTQWAADWLVSQNQTAKEIMLANAAVSASVPIHALNADGSLVTVENHPNFWLDERNSQDRQKVEYGKIIDDSGWTPDTAHMPDLAYFAALTTGSHYMLDQLQAQANYDLLSLSPQYRADKSALIGLQERGLAWTIRDLTNAAALTPDNDPLKAYFSGQLDNIIQNLLDTWVHGARGAAQGELQGYIMGAFDSNQVAPWQQGYLAIALGQAAAHGVEGAAEVLGWMNNFLTGLYLNGANGYNPLEGSGYWLTTGTGSLGSHNYHSFTTWAEFYRANFAGQAAPTSLNGYTDDPVGGFSTIAKAALATAWNVTHSADDLAAYAYVTQHTPEIIKNYNGYAAAATWNITPVLNNGHQLQNNEVFYGNGGTTTATTSSSLLASLSGNNTLQSGNGDSILIGGGGTDVLKGGAGNDFLFAGTGNQTLYGGAGTNYLEGHLNGGTGVDHFQFNAADNAHDTVVNFKPGFDSLDITGGGGSSALSALALLAAATTTAAGDLVLHLSAHHDVVLQGVHFSQQLDVLHSLHLS